MVRLTPAIMLAGYRRGIFPMAESRHSPTVSWIEPRMRGVIPLDGFHISRSLRKAILRGDYQIALDQDFHGVVAGCAERRETWINPALDQLYLDLHLQGQAHSIEVRREGRLIGGVFGVSFGRVFCGETMFSRERDASKIALAYLVDHLRASGFRLFDTQFLTPHLASLGAIEIPQADYVILLKAAQDGDDANIGRRPLPTPQLLLQRMTQMS